MTLKRLRLKTCQLPQGEKLNLDDFKLVDFTVQIEHKTCFRVWDRAGAAAMALEEIWGDLNIDQATPAEQTYHGKAVKITSGIRVSHITLVKSKTVDSNSIEKIQKTVDAWREIYELDVIKRLSARIKYVKYFPSIGDANLALHNLGMVRRPESKVFDISTKSEKNSSDLNIKFEDETSFAFLKLRTETINIESEEIPEFDIDGMKKSLHRLALDFDRGIVGEVDLKKIRAGDWIKGFLHLLRRDLPKVFSHE